VTLGTFDRSDEAIAVFDDLVARFGSATEPELHEKVERAQAAKRDLLVASSAESKRKSGSSQRDDLD
jgi:hypothetical protein